MPRHSLDFPAISELHSELYKLRQSKYLFESIWNVFEKISSSDKDSLLDEIEFFVQIHESRLRDSLDRIQEILEAE